MRASSGVGVAALDGRFAQRVRDDRIVAMRGDVRVEMRVGIRKEHVFHEADGRRRPFDIGDDRAA